MKYEYAIMKQVGDEEPVKWNSYTYSSFEEADEEVDRYNESNQAVITRGVLIRTIEEAEAGIKQIEEAKKTRYFVGRRPAGEWEECNRWEQ